MQLYFIYFSFYKLTGLKNYNSFIYIVYFILSDRLLQILVLMVCKDYKLYLTYK